MPHQNPTPHVSFCANIPQHRAPVPEDGSMPVIAMDTFEAVKHLKAAGFTEAQAEAMTRIVRNAHEIDLSNLATKTDLAVTKADLEKALAETKADTLKWLVGSLGFQTVVIIGTMLALIRSVGHG